MKKHRLLTVFQATVLPAVGLVALFGVCLVVMHLFNSFGHHWAMAAAIAALLVGLVLGSRLRPAPSGESSHGGRFRRLFAHIRTPLIVVLTGWLGLIGWAEFSPGGPLPSAKTDPESIRVVTWNVLRGDE